MSQAASRSSASARPTTRKASGRTRARRSRRRRPSARSPTPASRPRTSTASCTAPFSATQLRRARRSTRTSARAHELWVSRRGRRHGVGGVGAATTPRCALRSGRARPSSTSSRSPWATQRAQMVGGPGQVHAEELYKQNLEVPFGWFPQPVYFATIARRHMHEFGTDRGAARRDRRRLPPAREPHPGAVMRDKPLSLADYLAQPDDRRSVPQGGLLPDLRRRRRLRDDVAGARARSAPARRRGARRRRRQLADRRSTGRSRATSPSTPQVFAAPGAFAMAGLDAARRRRARLLRPVHDRLADADRGHGLLPQGRGRRLRRGRRRSTSTAGACRTTRTAACSRTPTCSASRTSSRSCASSAARRRRRCRTRASPSTAATPAAGEHARPGAAT